MEGISEEHAEAVEALEAFVIDNDELEALEERVRGFNLFEALGNTRREERHSDFLSFLLSPSESHGLGDVFLRRLLQETVLSEPERPSTLRRIDLALFDFSEAVVEREWNRIDLLIQSHEHRLVVLIENKVDTDEHDNQLERYLTLVRARFADWHVLPVFLTPDGRTASHPAYYSISYGTVHDILHGVLTRTRGSLTADVEVAIRHYVELLERHIMPDTPIAELARRIYARHRRALDLIFEHRPDAQQVMRDAVEDKLDGFRVVYTSKATIHAVPHAWDAIDALRDGGRRDWYRSPEVLRFEFRQSAGLSVHLLIGPADAETRDRLYVASGATDARGLFRGRSKKKAEHYTQLWKHVFYTKADEAKLSIEEKQKTFARQWAELEKTTLPSLTRFFVDLYES